MPKIYSYFDLPDKPGLECLDPTLAQQHFAADADINNIIAKYERTGFLTDPLTVATGQPIFDDFTGQSDFLAAQTLIAHASQAFDELPSSLRKRFNNDPSELLAFLENDGNREEAARLGLISEIRSSDSRTSTSVVLDGSVTSVSKATGE